MKIDRRWIGLNGPTDLVDPERRGRHHRHQRHPDPADRPVRQRSLGGSKLDKAEHEGGHGGKGVQRDRWSGLKQRRNAHAGVSPIDGQPM
ncbi:hypothetical protein ABIC01_002717 [Bradyrhizobium sp. RT4b]